MPKTNVYDMSGKQVGEIELSEALFGIEPNQSVVHDVVKNHLANCRQGTQSALTRAEVSGGGKKPWRQKGTGRAPQWSHGGIVFAPKPRDYSYTLNKKVKRLALKSVLSAKAASQDIVVIDSIKMNEIKTKEFAKFLSAVNAESKPLVVTAEPDTNVVRSGRNIPGCEITFANLINVYDILNAKKLVLDQAALAKISRGPPPCLQEGNGEAHRRFQDHRVLRGYGLIQISIKERNAKWLLEHLSLIPRRVET